MTAPQRLFRKVRRMGRIDSSVEISKEIPPAWYEDDYDALLFSGNSGAGTPAKAGFPSIVVPGGSFPNIVGPPDLTVAGTSK